jgi:hypothetical protein
MEIKSWRRGLREKGGKFEKGWEGGPGRQKGGHNKTTRMLKDALLLAAGEVGDLSGIAREDLSKEGIEKGKDGLVGYLRWAAKCEPKAFLHILGKPSQMKVDTFTPPVYHSVEELGHAISQRGLNMKSFGQLLIEAHEAKAGEVNAGKNTTIDNNNRDSVDVDNSRDTVDIHRRSSEGREKS